MNKFFCFGLAMGITALTMLAGCGSTDKSASPAPATDGTHIMPDGTKMTDKDMKK